MWLNVADPATVLPSAATVTVTVCAVPQFPVAPPVNVNTPGAWLTVPMSDPVAVPTVTVADPVGSVANRTVYVSLGPPSVTRSTLGSMSRCAPAGATVTESRAAS